jgi:hypothetical protein
MVGLCLSPLPPHLSSSAEGLLRRALLIMMWLTVSVLQVLPVSWFPLRYLCVFE